MRTSIKFVACIAAMVIPFYAQAYPGEGIVRDPATGNYTITYRGDQNSTELSQTVFVPSTKIEPTIRSIFHQGKRGDIMYRYTVSNGATAKQALVGVALDNIVNPVIGEIPFPQGSFPNEAAEKAAYDAYNAAVKAATAAPVGWGGHITRNDELNRIYWSPNAATFNTGGILAGRALTGFGFSSLDLPGIGSSKMDGLYADSEIFGFPDDGPLQDSAILGELDRLRDNDFVARPAAVPMIVVPSPFDAATLLGNIQAQMHTWIAMKLLDATFSSQLDRYFQSAISSYAHNQPKAGREHIETMRKMLKREHEDLGRDEEHESYRNHEQDDDRKSLIDRLAARVLDFDLDYVLERMEDDHHGRD